MGHNYEKVFGVVLKAYPRLSETFILNEIYLLEKLGLKLHIFAMRKPDNKKDHERVSQIQAGVSYVPDYFWRFFFSFIYTNIRLFFNRPGRYWAAFKFALSYSWKQRDSAALKRFAQAAFLVQRRLPGTDVSFFYSHFANDPTTMTYFASWLTGIPYSISAHAKDIYLHEAEFLRLKLAKARFVTTCTGFNTDYLSRMDVGKTKVFRSYHGIDLGMYPYRGSREPNARPEILSIGRYVPKKGFLTMIRALALLRKKGIGFHCTIIGDGPQKPEMAALIQELGLTDSIELVPPMSQQELFAFYQKADVFALACEVQNNGDRDGIPNVIVEAMAMGIPVVSTAISGIPECVEDGETGILIGERAPVAFSEALFRIIRRPSEAAAYGKAGRQKVERLFDAEQNVQRIVDALQAAANQHAVKRETAGEMQSALAASRV